MHAVRVCRWGIAALVFLLICGGFGLILPDAIRVGAFSTQDPTRAVPRGWEQIHFAKIDEETDYDLVQRDSTVVVRAQSHGGAGALATRRTIDLTEYPILEWRWKVETVVEAGNARTEDGDDYAARLYVTFDYDGLGIVDQAKLIALRALGYDNIPTRALNYIWANQVDRYTILENAYTDWVMMVALRSGRSKTGTWVTERRNVLADYRAAFGGDPPPVNGVAIMTDTDNTAGQATAYYGDIVFRRHSRADASSGRNAGP